MPVTTAHPLRTLVAVLAIAALAASASVRAASLALSFGDRSVTINGVTPGGDVAFFAIAKEPSTSVPAIPLKTEYALVLHDDDRDGKVIFVRERALPAIGIWVAVDIGTGQWVASGSPGFDARLIALPEFVQHDDTGQLRKLSAAVPEMYVLLVRPGTGVWGIHAAKTSALDESSHGERRLRIDVTRMVSVSTSLPAPISFERGDILALIEPEAMRYAVVEVGR